MSQSNGCGKTSGTEEHGVAETEKTRIAEQQVVGDRKQGKDSEVDKNISKIGTNDIRQESQQDQQPSP